MRIESVEVERFRCIKHDEVSLGRVTTFIGRNGVGKSTLLYALESFYNVGAQYSRFDYYNHVLADVSIRIRVTYADLRADELAEFGGYVHGGKLSVVKVINQGGARYFGTTSQIPVLADLRRVGARDRKAGLRAAVDCGDLPEFPDIPARDEEVNRAMEAYEAAHPEMTQPVERETQFLGPRNVGGGKLDKFTKFVLVPAVRDAASEMEKRGAIMQLLDLIVTRSIDSRDDFRQFRQEFETKARELYDKTNLPELTNLGALVTERLRRYAPGAELVIDFDELVAPAIPLPDAIVTVAEDDFKVPVKYSGHGLQRALILALLEQLSVTITPPASSAREGDEQREEVPRADRPPDLILAIEEPELYLHPARSRYLARILRELAAPAEGPHSQVLCVTHSPYFVSVDQFDEIRMCRKVAGEGDGEPRHTRFTTYTRQQAADRLAQLTGKPADTFTAQTFVAHAAPVLNSIVNEGLFGEVAVVVEGDSDVAAIWATQTRLKLNWDELGVVVVPVGGKTKIDRAVVVFEGFGIPTFFVFDGDKKKNDAADANRMLLRLGGEDEEDYPVTSVRAKLAVFEENIESYLEKECGDKFADLRESCAKKFGHTRIGAALKNADVMAAFIEAACEAGVQFPILEAAAKAISALAKPPAPPQARAAGVGSSWTRGEIRWT